MRIYDDCRNVLDRQSLPAKRCGVELLETHYSNDSRKGRRCLLVCFQKPVLERSAEGGLKCKLDQLRRRLRTKQGAFINLGTYARR